MNPILRTALTLAAKHVAKPVLRKIGDRMARAKKPFWRKVVGAFRSE